MIWLVERHREPPMHYFVDNRGDTEGNEALSSETERARQLTTEARSHRQTNHGASSRSPDTLVCMHAGTPRPQSPLLRQKKSEVTIARGRCVRSSICACMYVCTRRFFLRSTRIIVNNRCSGGVYSTLAPGPPRKTASRYTANASLPHYAAVGRFCMNEIFSLSNFKILLDGHALFIDASYSIFLF